MENFWNWLNQFLLVTGLITTLTGFGAFILKYLPEERKNYLIYRIHKIFKRKRQSNFPLESLLQIGDIRLDNFKLLDGIDNNYKVYFRDTGAIANLPEDLKKISDRLIQENESRKESNKGRIYNDLKPYSLSSIAFSREEGDGEHNICHLQLKSSSFFYSLISTYSMNEEIEPGVSVNDRYYRQISENPYIPTPNGEDLVHTIGVNVLVVTKDLKIVIPKRNEKNVASSGNQYHISCAEHLNKELVDLDDRREISILKVAKRGLFQELYIDETDFNERQLKFYAMGFAPKQCHYGAIGFVKLNITSDELLRKFEFAKDGKYEIDSFLFVDFTLKGIKLFFENVDGVLTQWLIASIIICYFQYQQSEKTLTGFGKHFKGELWSSHFKSKIGEL